MTKVKTTDNVIYNKTTKKTKYWATGIPLKTGGERRSFGRVCNSCSTSDTRFKTIFMDMFMRGTRRTTQDKWKISVANDYLSRNGLALRTLTYSCFERCKIIHSKLYSCFAPHW